MKKTVLKKEVSGYRELPLMPITFAPSTDNQTGFWKTYTPKFEREKCIQCAICWKFCPEPCITMGGDGYPVWDMDHCKGCGICANECPKDAIKMTLEE